VEEVKAKVTDFLNKNEMDPADIEMENTCRLFLQEMEKGLAAEQSSLAMLPTYIEIERRIPLDKPVIVMDAGGTNFRVATVSFDQEGNSKIENFKLFSMPGVKQQVSKDEFFKTMAGYLDEVVDKSANIGFCFSYPIEIFPNKDGRVLFFSKEIKADEVAGNMIGQNLNAAISSSGNADKKNIILLNDTVATLLAGRADVKGMSYETYIGFILGTGTNCSYIEANKKITKTKDLDPAKSQIVNVESGGFGKAPQGKIDKDFDQSSNCPGMYTVEKMISGAYLGQMCLWTVRKAAEDGLLSNDTARNLNQIKEITTKDVNDFMSYPQGGSGPLSSALKTASPEDLATAYYLIDRLIERAAKLTAINLSAAAIKSDKGHNPSRPVCIVAEGTTFYHLKSLKQRVEYYLKDYLVNQKGVFYEIINVENATLIGAAIAGLTN
jgi:hexokinase